MKRILLLIAVMVFGSAVLMTPALAAKEPDGCVKVSIAVEGKKDKCVGSEDDNPIIAYTRVAIRFASGIFGLLIVMTILISSIQYITSQGYPDQLKNAKSRLTNAVVGLILFILAFGILEFLIPGKIFG